VKKYLDLATALFALMAAFFWFWASSVNLPPTVAYWDATPPSDPHTLAVARSARLNSIAAFLSGLSAACAFLSYLAGPSP
jgi:hypothetical protein